MNLDKHPVCAPHDLLHAEHQRSNYCFKVDPSVKFEDITSPKFWARIKNPAPQVGDLIEVVSPTLDVLLRVTVSADGLIMTRVSRAWEEKTAAAKAGRIVYLPAGSKKGFRVLDEAGVEIAHSLASKAEAEAVLAERRSA